MATRVASLWLDRAANQWFKGFKGDQYPAFAIQENRPLSLYVALYALYALYGLVQTPYTGDQFRRSR